MKGFAQAIALAIIVLFVCSFTESNPGHQDKRPARKRGSFGEFALGQLNPAETDYGCVLAEGRRIAIAETFETVEFWTALLAFVFLLISSVIVIHQRQERDRRELISAQFLSQYHNALMDARQQTASVILQHNQAIESFNAGSSVKGKLPDPGVTTSATHAHLAAGESRNRSERGTTVSGVIHEIHAGKISNEVKEQAPEIDAPQKELIAQLRTLQQQLTAAHQRESALQRQLSNKQRPSAGGKLRNSDLGI